MARSSARERLLDCAEALFAEHGLEGVSLRAINAAAGLSAAALHYHFGSQQALLEAILERRMPALMERRRELLDELEERPDPISARDVLEALMRPLTELSSDGGEPGLRYLRLLHRLQSDGDIDPAFVVARWPGGVDRLVPLLRRALPALPVPLLELRLSLAIDAILASLAKRSVRSSETLDAHAGAVLDFLTGALEAQTHAPAAGSAGSD